MACRSYGRKASKLFRNSGHRRRYATSAMGPFDWEDPLRTNTLLTDEERAIAETAEAYCQEKLLPRVQGRYPGTLCDL